MRACYDEDPVVMPEVIINKYGRSIPPTDMPTFIHPCRRITIGFDAPR